MDLNGQKVAFLATDMVEKVELTKAWKAVEIGEVGPLQRLDEVGLSRN